MKFLLSVIAVSFALALTLQVRADATEPMLSVLKSPTCGCCVKWMEHLHDNGFVTTVEEPENLAERKALLGISPR